jgi:hypothetical protein
MQHHGEKKHWQGNPTVQAQRLFVHAQSTLDFVGPKGLEMSASDCAVLGCGCWGIRHSHGLAGSLFFATRALVDGTLAGALLAVRLDAAAREVSFVGPAAERCQNRVR